MAQSRRVEMKCTCIPRTSKIASATILLLSAALTAATASQPAFVAPSNATPAALAVKNLRCEYKLDPLGIDVLRPRLSWELTSPDRGILQTSYELRVTVSLPDLAKNKTLWASGNVASDASNQIAYTGPALESGKTYFWQVRVADNHGHISDWSAPAHWEMGLLNSSDWQAKWIAPNLPEDGSQSNPAPLLRRDFTLTSKKKIERARLYASALGLYELELNGHRVGDEYFTPGWTAYDFRLQYQTYDVTSSLKSGANSLGAILGDGWYRGRSGWEGKRNLYGSKLALLAQLVVRYSDGSQETITTDENWKSSTGPLLLSDIYDGEVYDARLEKKGWSAPGFDDHDWKAVSALAAPKAKIVASAGPPVRAIDELKPLKIFTTPAGDTLLDMGQNMVGWVRFRINAPAGTTISLRHAEVLDKQGNFYTANLRTAKETIRYTTRGEGQETYQPHFTFQGFRYVAVSGWPGQLQPENFTGIVVHSDMRRTGHFESSSLMLDQLEHNIIWGQKGNFVDVPTDCPQRDERLGWTGDAQVFAPTASFNFDTAAFYTKWLRDVALDQQDDGAVPFVIPNVLSHDTRKGASGSAGWADVAVVLPWTLYEAFGDKRILEEQYSSMKAWVEYMHHQSGEKLIWTSGFSFGDWLAFATNSAAYPGATTAMDYLQTAYFAHSTSLLARTAEILGKHDDAAHYSELAQQIRAAFLKEYVTPNARLSSDTQTAYAIALKFDLLPESLRAAAAARLADDVRHFKHLTTGFLGTPVLCKALSDYGYLDEAYMLLNRTEYPSWLYPVTQGATTIWERWDGQKPDGTFQDVGMNSFNHYAYGAIGEWMYSVVAGLEIDDYAPGYKHIIIAPQPGGGLSDAKASIDSIYGPVASGWEIAQGKLTLRLTIPPNTTATVRVPNAKLDDLREAGKPLAGRDEFSAAHQDHDTVVLNVGSGSYIFESPCPTQPTATKDGN
jgi:alpha-L-rhamnosidase